MQLRLKVLWLKNFLGFSLQQQQGSTSLNLTPYYFWPKTSVWEQINLELISKPWLTEEEKIATLNLVTEVMEYWKQYRNSATPHTLKTHFTEVEFADVQD